MTDQDHLIDGWEPSPYLPDAASVIIASMALDPYYGGPDPLAPEWWPYLVVNDERLQEALDRLQDLRKRGTLAGTPQVEASLDRWL